MTAIAGAGLASAAIEQVGTLQVKVTGNLSSKQLPREDKAPVAVSVGYKVAPPTAPSRRR